MCGFGFLACFFKAISWWTASGESALFFIRPGFCLWPLTPRVRLFSHLSRSFLVAVYEKSIGRSTPRSPWGCRRRPSSSCTCRDSRTSCLLQFRRNDPSLPRLEPAGCAAPTSWTTSAVVDLTRCRLSQTQLRYYAKPLSRVTVDVTLFRLSHEPDMSVPKCSITTVCRFCQRAGVLQPFSPILCQLPREAFTHRNCYSKGFWALLVHFSFSFSPSRSMVSSWSGRNNSFTLEARALNDHLGFLFWSSSPEVTCAVVQSLPSSSPTNNIVHQCIEQKHSCSISI